MSNLKRKMMHGSLFAPAFAPSVFAQPVLTATELYNRKLPAPVNLAELHAASAPEIGDHLAEINDVRRA